MVQQICSQIARRGELPATLQIRYKQNSDTHLSGTVKTEQTGFHAHLQYIYDRALQVKFESQILHELVS